MKKTEKKDKPEKTKLESEKTEGISPFVYIAEINQGKHDLMTGSNNDELMEKSYNPFVTNRQFSYFPDTVFLANNMNQSPGLDKKLQFHYYLYNVSPRKRFQRWTKPLKIDDIESIIKFFKVNIKRAIEISTLLDTAQIDQVKQRLITGGT